MQKKAICSTSSLQIGLNEAKIRKLTCLRNLPQVCYRAVSRLRNLPQVYYRAESHLRNLPQIIPELNHVCGRFRKYVDF